MITKENNILQEEVALLRDALDHIARIAASPRKPTKRLDWISARAQEALLGETWSREYLPEPKKQIDMRVKELQSALFDLINASNTGNIAETQRAVDVIRYRFPSLFRINRSNRDSTC